jgi:hypothetical protein
MVMLLSLICDPPGAGTTRRQRSSSRFTPLLLELGDGRRILERGQVVDDRLHDVDQVTEDLDRPQLQQTSLDKNDPLQIADAVFQPAGVAGRVFHDLPMRSPTFGLSFSTSRRATVRNARKPKSAPLSVRIVTIG